MQPAGSVVPQVPAPVAAALRPLPLLLLRPPLAMLAVRIRDRHPELFERLGPHAAKRFGLDPTDLPFAFVLEPRPAAPSVTPVRRLPRDLDVRIAGPLGALLGMVDGAFDGDALFFSRSLQVEGDMEALLALRNAVDDACIDLRWIALSPLGPAADPLDRAFRRVRAAAGRVAAHRTESRSWN
jgi:predicted lipid carrier protein YhbT